MSRPVTVILFDGFGNQLFRYYAGFKLASLCQTGLRLDDSLFNHETSLRSFDLSCEWVRPKRESSLIPTFEIRKLSTRVSMRMARSMPALSKAFGFYISSTIGYDADLYCQTSGTKIQSLSMSLKSLNEAISVGAPYKLQLLQESNWLTEMRDEAQCVGPIMMHFRRGDYISTDFGLLYSSFYLRAIELLCVTGLSGPIWIFTDEIKAVPKELLEVGEVLNSPIGAAEELVLMSQVARISQPIRHLVGGEFGSTPEKFRYYFHALGFE